MLVVLVVAASILGFTALASVRRRAWPARPSAGPHGFSEILYAFTTQTGNNGSAFGSLTGNTPFYNVAGGIAMLLGRFGMIIPVLAIAGSMAAKRRVAPSLGTFPTTGPLFVGLLIGVIVIVGALTFFPALALGPIVEELPRTPGGPFHELAAVRDRYDPWQPSSPASRTRGAGDGRQRRREWQPNPSRSRGILDPTLLRAALPEAIRKLDPRTLVRNPVIFVVEIAAVLVTLVWRRGR